MAVESLVFDGLSLSSGNYTLSSVSLSPPKKKPEWAESSDADGALLIRDPLFENRTVELDLRVRATTRDLSQQYIQAINWKLEEAEKRRGGLALIWTPINSTTSYTLYVLSGEITDVPMTNESGYLTNLTPLTITLTTKPFLYAAEVTTSTTTSTTPLLTLTVTSVPGDVPAEARLVVSDNATKDRWYVAWGLEQRYYNAATSLLLDSDDLTTSGFAGSQTTRSGSYDPNAAGNNVIRATLTTIPVAICGTGNQSHVGTYRVMARVYASDVATWVRLSWKEGDGPLNSNPYVQVPAEDDFTELDLGLISIPEKLLGTQRWQGQVEAYSTVSGATLDVDYISLVPAGEGYGKARTILSDDAAQTFSARDDFETPSIGTDLTGTTAPVGGVWAEAGDVDGYTIQDSIYASQGAGGAAGKIARRTAVSDVDLNTGHYEILGATNYTNTVVQADFARANIKTDELAAGEELRRGVIARYVDTSNWLMAVLRAHPSSGAGQGVTATETFAVYIRVGGGTPTQLGLVALDEAHANFHSVKLLADSAGHWYAYAGPTLPGTPQLSGYHSALATGGALDDGKPGLYDAYNDSAANTREVNNFLAWTWVTPPVIHSGQSIEFRSDEVQREDSTGTYWGDPPSYRGADFFLPEAGDPARISRIAVMARRNDIETMAEPNVTDSTQAAVSYTPRFLWPR